MLAGNAGHTLITRSFARQLGLVDMHGNPTQSYSRTIKVRGVVAGAVETIKTLNITYEIKGKQLGSNATLQPGFGLPKFNAGCCMLQSQCTDCISGACSLGTSSLKHSDCCWISCGIWHPFCMIIFGGLQ